MTRAGLPAGWKDRRDIALFGLGVGCLGWGLLLEHGEERIIVFSMSAALMGLPGALFAYRNDERAHDAG